MEILPIFIGFDMKPSHTIKKSHQFVLKIFGFSQLFFCFVFVLEKQTMDI